MIESKALLELAKRGLAAAKAAGADQAEVCVGASQSADVELQKNDVHTASTSEETSFGIRVIKGGSVGFATCNGVDRLEQAAAEAVSMARAAPPDEKNGLGAARSIDPFERVPDPAIEKVGIGDLVEIAADMLERVRGIDARITIDSGDVHASVGASAIASTEGVELHRSSASAGANLMGMAVDGDDVGSFDYDGCTVLRWDALGAGLNEFIPRFADKCVGALGARAGETFKGTVILAPEVAAQFVVGNLLSVMNAKAVRTGQSPLADKVGEAVAAPGITIVEDPRLPEGLASRAYDREGMPTATRTLVEGGVLRGFLYDVYEARAAGVEPTGHARGGATAMPAIGPSNLLLAAGDTPLADLCSAPERAILVNRFSGSSNPITGEFSGVVKGGFLLRKGERTPIHETMIAGNLYELLRDISAVSRERRVLRSTLWVPTLRVENVSVTAS